jgi:hypothetical protein
MVGGGANIHLQLMGHHDNLRWKALLWLEISLTAREVNVGVKIAMLWRRMRCRPVASEPCAVNIPWMLEAFQAVFVLLLLVRQQKAQDAPIQLETCRTCHWISTCPAHQFVILDERLRLSGITSIKKGKKTGEVRVS